jgi:hypothetical protein
MDGQERELHELLPYMKEGVDPRIPIRLWRRHHRNMVRRGETLPPLDVQISYGKEHMVKFCLDDMEERGEIESIRNGREWENESIVWCTPKGKEKVVRMTFAAAQRNETKNEFYKLYKEGKITINLHLNGKAKT